MLVTLVSVTFVQARLASASLERLLAEDAETIGRELVQKTGAAAKGETDFTIDDAVRDASRSPRVVAVSVADAQMRALMTSVRDTRSHSALLQEKREAVGEIPLGMTARLEGDWGLAYVYRAAIWTSPDTLFGYATVLVRDAHHERAAANIHRAALLAALLVGIVTAPVSIIAVRRMSRPLQRVALAAEQLAEGEDPDPLPERGPTEIASLSRSFNRMAVSLTNARDALLRSNQDLERAVQDRTAELSRVNDLLRLELGEKAEFIRSISHDLSAPLRNIAGMITLIRRRHSASLPDDAVHRLERIEANVALEQEMLRDLLELSRLGVMPERPDEVDTAALAREVAGSFEHDLRSRGITLTIRDPLPRVYLERARLRQTLQNLIDNAIKYMGEREERRIDIAAVVDARGAVFTVADTGPGIPEHEQATIFQIFRRASTATPGIRGSGVGLASVRAIVDRWGGHLLLESSPGRGSRFIFTVPPDRVLGPDCAKAA